MRQNYKLIMPQTSCGLPLPSFMSGAGSAALSGWLQVPAHHHSGWLWDVGVCSGQVKHHRRAFCLSMELVQAVDLGTTLSCGLHRTAPASSRQHLCRHGIRW